MDREETPDIFPEAEIVSREPEPPPEPNEWPYFVLAYWPRNANWKIVVQGLGAHEAWSEMKDWQKRGWTHVTVCKLPDVLK